MNLYRRLARIDPDLREIIDVRTVKEGGVILVLDVGYLKRPAP